MEAGSMYFPYLRGRQYDLLALKELAQGKMISPKILPVVEPVKISSTLSGTIKVYKSSKLQMALILNPMVEDLSEEDTSSLQQLLDETIIPAIIMNEDAERIIRDLEKHDVQRSNVLVILNSRDYVAEYKRMFWDSGAIYTLFPDERSIRRAVTQKKVLFEDKFNKLNKNADYAKNTDEFFSEDHLFYLEEGYTGFGDYSIIGESYDVSGFAPRAVAIHIVYLDGSNNLRVHHFVSDSNYGIEDIAGKYYEAVTKLKKWYHEGNEKQETQALSVLLEHADTGYFPGLPTIKKLSIMHHIELVDKFLNMELK